MTFASPRAAAWNGRRDALNAPALVLGASYIGFGSLCRASHLSLIQGLTSTTTAWALPGQVAMIELYGVGASFVAIVLAVALANARLLPMTITLTPLLRSADTPRWRIYLAAHFIAVTAWAQGMQRCPNLPREHRLPYFFGFATTLWLVTLVGTVVGFFAAGQLPASVSLGLVFLNPIYFMLVFLVDLRQRLRALALGLGAVLGPALATVAADWALPLTGLLAGSAAFLIDRHLGRRRA